MTKRLFVLLSILLLPTATACGGGKDPLVEAVAAIEHEQWTTWSKSVAAEVSPERRARWEKYWVPYEELPEDVKELDRIWARKVIKETRRSR
jgi:uncharacterized membrane protein